jgi:hypothetical protein
MNIYIYILFKEPPALMTFVNCPRNINHSVSKIFYNKEIPGSRMVRSMLAFNLSTFVFTLIGKTFCLSALLLMLSFAPQQLLLL